jgi:hypothetical protein
MKSEIDLWYRLLILECSKGIFDLGSVLNPRWERCGFNAFHDGGYTRVR